MRIRLRTSELALSYLWICGRAALFQICHMCTPEPHVHPNSTPLFCFNRVILLVATLEVMVWSYLVNLVNVSSLYWQETFARRCLLLNLTWFRQCACFGVEVHSLNMSSVMSRVSNGVGHWVSLAIDWELAVSLAWRRRSNHSGHGREVPWGFSLPTRTRKCWTSRDGTGSGASESCRSLPPRSVLTQPSLGTAGQSAEFLRNGTSRRDCRSSNRRRLRRLPPETADKIAERVKSLEMAV